MFWEKFHSLVDDSRPMSLKRALNGPIGFKDATLDIERGKCWKEKDMLPLFSFCHDEKP